MTENNNSDDYSLYEIFLKGEFKSIKHTNYFLVYEQLFSQFRNKPITFMEIGVLGGGSLFMWREYFGKSARIIGVDLNPVAKKWEAHGFEIYIGDQADIDFWRKTTEEIGGIDIVLDDGGHTYGQQIVTTHCLLSSIRDGGMLIVEDTHTSYMDGFGPKKYSFINYVKNKIDEVNFRSSEVKETAKANSFIWSTECFESIIAFKINRLFARRESIMIVNQGLDDEAVDFRDSSSILIVNLRKIGKKINNSALRLVALYAYKRLHHLITFFEGIKLWVYFKK